MKKINPSKQKILIIDDEKLNILLVNNYLKKYYTTFLALNADEGTTHLEKNKIDLILLDIMMPPPDGFEFCEILKKNKKYKNIPIIFITAKTDIESINKAFEIGGMDYITKPFNKEELYARIKTHIELATSKRQLKLELIKRKHLQKQIISTIYKTEEKERKRFSNEIHDGLGVLLSSVKLYLNTISSQELNNDEIHQTLNQADELITQAILTSNEIANNIHSSVLNKFGLKKALIKNIEKISILGKININYNFQEFNTVLEKKIEIIIFRTINELINNTLKYAKASIIILKIYETNSKLVIEYFDNGIGFDIKYCINTKGTGLKNIFAKIKSINGKYKIKSKAENGMSFYLELTI